MTESNGLANGLPESKALPRVTMELHHDGDHEGIYIDMAVDCENPNLKKEEYLSITEHSQILSSWIKRAEEGEKERDEWKDCATALENKKFSEPDREISKHLNAQLAVEVSRREKLVEALESARSIIDDDYVTTETPDGEKEDWVNFNALKNIVDEALAEHKKSESGGQTNQEILDRIEKAKNDQRLQHIRLKDGESVS